MPKSYKPAVIEHIFKSLLDPTTGKLSRTLVDSTDIQNAKRHLNQTFGLTIKVNSNPFNFMKDIVRGKTAGKLWPATVKAQGYIGEQRTGDSAVFEFVPFSEGAPNSLEFDFTPSPTTPQFKLQSLSLPQASKLLGRRDEAWLLQVAVNLRVIETHFAVGVDKQIDAQEISHLQMDLKLRKVQIDALFLAHYVSARTGSAETAIVTVEAKQENQRILSEQIGRQVIAVFSATKTDLVIPLGIAAIRGVGIYVVEFKSVHRSALSTFGAPTFHRDASFLLEPPVKGI